MRLTRFVAASLLVVLASCSSGSDQTTATGILGKIASVQTTTGVLATVKQGSVTSGQGGPDAQLPSILSVINGGTSAVPVSAPVPFYRVSVAVDGVSDYYELLLPAGSNQMALGGNAAAIRAGTSVTLLITLAQHVTDRTLPLAITVADINGKYGNTQHLSATITQVGSGDVQISLSWDAPSDVDLHVTGPDNTEIYFANKTSPTGGKLDLDSNPSCAIDNVDNENVTWPTGTAPSGTYTVSADYYSSCNVTATHYVLTVTLNGQTPRIFQGTFTGAGDFNATGGPRVITTFTK